MIPPASELNALLLHVAGTRDRAAFGQLFAHFAPRVKTFMLRASDRVYMGGGGMQSVISAGMQFDVNKR